MRYGRKFVPLVLAAAMALAALPIFPQSLNNENRVSIDFSRVDAYVRSMPKYPSAALVAASLGRAAKTEWEKARAIYDWV
ncbi:MAG: hypothetical protein NT061_07015, partial [Spirochaetes bacterium]|nr:hypothetical protein [Spirochaetota bacterium]